MGQIQKSTKMNTHYIEDTLYKLQTAIIKQLSECSDVDEVCDIKRAFKNYLSCFEREVIRTIEDRIIDIKDSE